MKCRNIVSWHRKLMNTCYRMVLSQWTSQPTMGTGHLTMFGIRFLNSWPSFKKLHTHINEILNK